MAAPLKTGTVMSIADIAIGPRHRGDHGDIDGLAASIGELGLLQPIVIRPDGRLIAGERRLRAATLLGWASIPVNIVTGLDRIGARAGREDLRKLREHVRRHSINCDLCAREGCQNGEAPKLSRLLVPPRGAYRRHAPHRCRYPGDCRSPLRAGRPRPYDRPQHSPDVAGPPRAQSPHVGSPRPAAARPAHPASTHSALAKAIARNS